MIGMTVSALFLLVAVSTALSLIDSWIRGRSEYAALSREKALLDAGFVPEVAPREVRLRRPRRTTLSSINYRKGRRAPMLAYQISA